MLAESGLAREEMTDVADLLAPLGTSSTTRPHLRPSSLRCSARRARGRSSRRWPARCRGRRARARALRCRRHRPLGRRQHPAATPAAPGLAVLPRLPPLRPARTTSAAPSIAGAPGADARPGGGARPRHLAVDPRARARPCGGHRAACADGARQAFAHGPSHLVGRAQRRAEPCHRVGRPDRVDAAVRQRVPTPSDRPRDESGKGQHSPDPGQDDKGKGHGSDPGKGTDPGTGKGNKPGAGNGGHKPAPSPEPAPSSPTPPVPTAPQPDPPTPTLPLPDPLPGIDLPGLDGLTGQN